MKEFFKKLFGIYQSTKLDAIVLSDPLQTQDGWEYEIKINKSWTQYHIFGIIYKTIEDDRGKAF